MSEVLVVGSLAYDTISTPAGRAERTLGGSGNYFSLAASLFAPVRLVGVVGNDYDEKDIRLLKSRNVDLSGMEKLSGKTFHWEGEYKDDMNEAITKATHLNVFETFNPKLPEHFRDSKYVFLANIDPVLQMKVLDQVKKPEFVGMDTMNFWISSKVDELKKVLKRVDAILINEGEAKMLTKRGNAISAAQAIGDMGPKVVVVKRGEYGFVLWQAGSYFILPAFPIGTVVDPTGAGDTFAGGFFGYLAKYGLKESKTALRHAAVHGCLLASFTVQDFGVQGIAQVTQEMLEKRHLQFSEVISYSN